MGNLTVGQPVEDISRKTNISVSIFINTAVRSLIIHTVEFRRLSETTDDMTKLFKT